MPQYRRYHVPGATYFFTVVTHERRLLFQQQLARGCLRNAISDVQKKRPFDLFAIVLLPDHLHTIWTLPEGDSNYSLRWAQIKEAFTRSFLSNGGTEGVQTESRQRHRERAIWQRRFWEHTCRDEDDLKRCIDYLHWNPVKHKLVSRVRDYPWSTFRRFVHLGEYDLNWGGTNPCPGYHEPEWE